MADGSKVKLPPGFVLETSQAGGLPPGFVLESAAPAPREAVMPTPGFFESMGQGTVKDYASSLGNTFMGAAKSLGSAAVGISDMMPQNLIEDAVTGGYAKRTAPIREALKPKGVQQEAGKTITDIGQFATPTGAVAGVSKLPALAKLAAQYPKLAPLLAKAGVGGLQDMTVSTIQGQKPENVKTAGVLGAAAPLVSAGAGKVVDKAAKAIGKTLPENLISKLIRPDIKEFKFAKNPNAAIVDEGIIAKDFDDLIGKVEQKKQSVGKAIDALLTAPGNATKRVNLKAAIDAPIDEAIQGAAKTGDAKAIERFKQLRKQLTEHLDVDTGEFVGPKQLDSVAPGHAVLVKRDIGGSVTAWVEDPLENSVNQVKQDIYRSINSAVEAQVPGVKALQSRYANLLGAGKAAEKRALIEQRNNGIVGDGLTALVGGGLLGGEQTADKVTAGVGLALMRRAGQSTLSKTATAQVGKKVGKKMTRAELDALIQASKATYLGSRGER